MRKESLNCHLKCFFNKMCDSLISFICVKTKRECETRLGDIVRHCDVQFVCEKNENKE